VGTKFVLRPLYTVSTRQHWHDRSGLTLIGDAAHVTPPSAGPGRQQDDGSAELLVRGISSCVSSVSAKPLAGL
jgi:2-polyprenyl-6-methoxyphenol hydroxylase-like FAD-dependent oxidoreductase